LILIDTHVWIWFHSDSEKLSALAIEQLRTADRIAISTVSIYETMVAVEKGRIQSIFEPEALIRRWLGSSDIVRIPVSEEIVLKSRSLKFAHADPFDRIIAATAVHENAPLMTADRNLLQLAWLKTIPT
jgi:PIN domain nuclease of toxin-antitoxin system